MRCREHDALCCVAHDRCSVLDPVSDEAQLWNLEALSVPAVDTGARLCLRLKVSARQQHDNGS